MFLEKQPTKIGVREYKMGECICFNSYSKNFVLSNFYPCDIFDESTGLHFNSVEQMYYYHLFSQNPQFRKHIMGITGVYCGSQIRHYAKEHWNEIDADYADKHIKVLELCHYAKYKSCYDFRKKLQESGDIPLVEEAPWSDTYGAKPFRKEGVLRGQNICGRIMMKVRDGMRKEEKEKLNNGDN